MRAILILFIVYLNYVTSDNNFNKYVVKTYPKKVKPNYNGYGKIYINSGLFVKTKQPKVTKPAHRTYTAFQGVGKAEVAHGVPESPYFPIENTDENKPRVKKILPWSIGGRHKRSANEDGADLYRSRPSPFAYEKILYAKHIEDMEGPRDGQTNTVKKSKTINEDLIFNKSEAAKREESKIEEDSKTIAKEATNAENLRRAGKKSAAKQNLKSKQNTSKSKKSVRSQNNKKGPNVATKKGKLKGKSVNLRLKSVNSKGVPKTKGKPIKRTKLKQGSYKKGSIKTLRKGKGSNNKPNKNKPKILKKPLRSKASSKQSKNKQQEVKGKGKNIKRSKPNKVGAAKDNKVLDGRRLVAAREAVIDDYPYVVSIQKDRQHWCSGAILNPTLVITTANCVWRSKSFSRMTIRAGSTRVNEGGQRAKIVEVMKHPDWGIRRPPDCDVALLLLDRKLKFSHSLHAVDLPNRLMLPPFDDVWVCSWGSERRDGIYDSSSTSLQVYHARLMNHVKCNNITKRFLVPVTNNFFCLVQEGRNSPCTRDTGAPAVSDGVLWGLASWGIRKLCGTERYPAMFTYLAAHSIVDFIANATRYLMSDERYYPYPDRYPGENAPHPVYKEEVLEKRDMTDEMLH